MNLSPDYIIERKQNKNSLTRWKIATLLLILALIFISSSDHKDKILPSTLQTKTDYIASIKIEEVIFDDLARARKLQEIAKDDSIKAVIVHINSPGGSVVGAEMLYNGLRSIAKRKPVIAVMGSVAASGGYLAALGADYIMAHNSTITGSIGVIMQSAEITELAEKIGIKFDNFKSSPLKAAPNLTEKTTPEITKAIMENISDTYAYFTELVAERRGLDIKYVKSVADGRIYSGRDALKLKLIDSIGNEETAIKWLEDNKKIDKNLPIIALKLKPQEKLIDMFFEDFDIKILNFFYNKSQGVKAIW